MSSAADEIIGVYRRWADQWDRARTASAFHERQWLDKLSSLVPRPARILDIGCGGGEPVARHLIDAGHLVTGIDSSPRLIELCRARFPEHEWLVADMRTLALGVRFDGMLAWNSFFHLNPEDQRGMFPLFREHAAAGSVLMFTSGLSCGESIGSFEGEPLYHGSLDTAEYRELLARNGFTVLDHAVEDPTCGSQSIWLAQVR